MATPKYNVAGLEDALDDFIEHLHDDLPPGPSSELGGEVPSLRVTLSEREFKRRAAIGKAAVDARLATLRERE